MRKAPAFSCHARVRSHWTELKIGILALAAIAVAAIVIFLVSGEGGFFWQRYRLKAKFDNVAGLKPGAPVRVAGVEVGTVKGVELQRRRRGGHVRALEGDAGPRSRPSPRPSIGSVSLLGESALDLTPRGRARPVARTSTVKCQADAPRASWPTWPRVRPRSLEQATLLLKDIRAGKGTVGKLFTDEALYRDVQGFVDAAEGGGAEPARGTGTVGQLMNDDKVYRSLEASLRNLQDMTTRINAGEGSLGQAAERPGVRELAHLDDREHRHADGEDQQGRGHGGQARERPGALQQDELARRAARHADDAA